MPNTYLQRLLEKSNMTCIIIIPEMGFPLKLDKIQV